MKNNRGRFTIGVRIKGKRTKILVHRLAAYIKYGEKIFNDSLEIRHLNNICTDNSFYNLGIGTPHENMMDIPSEERKKRALFASSKLRKFSAEQIRKIKKDRENGFLYKDLSIKYNISKSSLSYFFNKAYYTGARNL